VGVRACKIEAVLAKPWRPNPREFGEVEELGHAALQAFEQGWKERFVRFSDLDLVSGIPEESR